LNKRRRQGVEELRTNRLGNQHRFEQLRQDVDVTDKNQIDKRASVSHDQPPGKYAIAQAAFTLRRLERAAPIAREPANELAK